ncbi:MAG: 6-bladed beta-propeller [Gemmatimonadota bacterium]
MLLTLAIGWTLPQANWRLVEVRRIGSIDERGQALTRVSAAIVDQKGAVLIAQPQEAMVRVFDSEGRPQHVLGRRGGGPGEFQSISTIVARNDTVYVSDFGQQRLTAFAQSGEVMGTWLVVSHPFNSDFRPAPAVAPMKGGLFLAVPSVPAALSARNLTTRIPVMLIDRDGTVEQTVDSLRWERKSGMIQRTGGVTFFTQPFTSESLWAISSDAAFLVIMHRDRGTEKVGVLEIGVFDGAGKEVIRKQVRVELQRLPSTVRDSLTEHWTKSFMKRGLSRREAQEIVAREIRIPVHFPAASQVLVTTSGTVWIGTPNSAAETRRWLVMDRSGTTIASLILPSSVRLLSVSDSAALGAITGEFEEPYVARYRIERSKNQ